MSFSEFVSLPYVGNIVGVISLIVGISSLVLTVITYRSAKRIEKRLPEERVSAINKLRFQEYKIKALETLDNRQKAVKRAGKVTKQALTELIEILNRIKGYDREINEKDMERINEYYLKLEILMNNNDYSKERSIVQFTEVITGLINILEKGEYSYDV